MFDYFAFGLRIRCDIPLPELVTASFEEPDLLIVRGAVDMPPAGAGGRAVEFRDDGIYLALGYLGRFVIRDRRQVDYMPEDGVDETLLNLAILGPLIALVLQARGSFVLHGSAIIANGQAAVFVGDKGAGKSTTIAALLAEGHAMLTDDVVAVDPGDDRVSVLPGYPQVKLSPAAAASLSLPDHQVIPTPLPHFDKRRIRLSGGFGGEVADAGAIYVLARGGAATVRQLSKGEALDAVLRYSYAARFSEDALSGARGLSHFRNAAAIAERVGVYWLQVPDSIVRIRDVLPLVTQGAA